MATCGPKRILHIKIGTGTADGKVGKLRAAAWGGGRLFIFLLIFTNLYRLPFFASFLILLFSINLYEIFEVVSTGFIASIVASLHVLAHLHKVPCFGLNRSARCHNSSFHIPFCLNWFLTNKTLKVTSKK